MGRVIGAIGTVNDQVICQRCGAMFEDSDALRDCPRCGVGIRSREGSKEKRTMQTGNVLPLGDQGKRTESAKQSLENLEKKIEQLVADGGTIQWQIGKALIEIYDGELWQIGDFESFRDYVVSRWDFTASTAKSYMRIASTFTQKDAAQFGLSELNLLSKVKDDDERAKLADRVRKEQPSFRELAELVKELRQKNGDSTVRDGMQDTIGLSGRVKAGVIAEGGWKTRASKFYFEFEIGGARIKVEDVAEDKKKGIEGGWIVKVLGPARGSDEE